MNVQAMSRSAAIRYCHQKHSEASVIISISTPGAQYTSAPFVSPDNGVKAVCRLTFADAERPGADVYGFNVTEKELIGEDDAARIRDFVAAHMDCTVIVHCDAGMSRSAGVAGAILRVMNGDDSPIFDTGYYIPNMRCYRKVLEAFAEGGYI